MTVISLLYLFALLAYAVLATLILAANPRSSLNRACALVLISFAIWCFGDIFHNLPLLPKNQALLFENISSFGWCSFPSTFVAFALVLTGWNPRRGRWLVNAALVGAPAVFVIMQFAGLMTVDYRLEWFGWAAVWSESAWPYAFYGYIVAGVMTGFVVLGRFAIVHPARAERRTALVALGTAAAAVLLGAATDIVLPRLGATGVPELAGITALVWAAGLYYTSRRYGLMTLTPEVAAPDILATMADAVLLLDSGDRVSSGNRALSELTGFASAELARRPAAELFDRPELFLEEVAELRASGERRNVLLDCRTRDGRVVPTSASARLRRSGRDDVTGSVWVLRDISGRLASERRLRESESSYRSFVETFQGIAFRGGMDFAIEFLHGGVATVTGYDEGDFLSGRVRWRDLIHPDDVAGLRAGTERLRTTPDFSITREYRIRRKDGSIGWVRETTSNVCDATGRPVRLHGAIFDVTDFRRALDTISSLSQFRESVIENSGLVVVVADARMNIVVWNRAAELLTGYAGADVIGSSRVWSLIFPDAEARRRMQEQGMAVAGGQTITDVDTTLLASDDTRHVVSWTFRPVIALEGTVTGFMALGRDITERRQADEAARRHLGTMTFLSQAALELAELAPAADAYEFIAERLRRLSGAAAVFMNSYDRTTRSLTLRVALGVDDRAIPVLGRRPEGLVLPVPEPALWNLLDARLQSLPGGLRDLALGALPDIVCQAIEQIYGLGRGYVVGIAWQGELIGSAGLLMPAGQELTEPAAVETLVHQAAITLRRRQAEDALRDSEASFRALTENAADSIAVFDSQGVCVYANQRTGEMVGAPIEAIIGSSITRWVRPEDAATVRERAERRVRGDDASGPYRITGVRADGTALPGEVTAARTIWHGQPASLLIIRDMTAHYAREAELFEAKELYDRLVSTLPDSITIVDLNGRIAYASPQTARNAGVPDASALVGLSVLDLTAPEDREAANRQLQGVFAGRSMDAVELTVVNRVGRRARARVSAALIRDARGEPKAIIASIRHLENGADA